MRKVGWVAMAALLLSLFSVRGAQAQIKPLSPSFDIHAGYHFFLWEAENFKHNFVVGGRVGFNFTPVFALEGQGQYIQSRTLITGKVGDIALLGGDLVIHLTRGKVVPYLLAGAGAKYYKVRDRVSEGDYRLDPVTGEALPIYKNPDWDFAIDAAFGLKLFPARGFAIRVEGRYIMSVGSNLDEGIPNQDGLLNDRFDDLQMTVAAYFSPGGKASDRDRDGLVDSKDQCPDDPEDFDEFEDIDGCPEPDNDKDGILDVDDDCRNDPESFNKYQDDDGCPDVAPPQDLDGDGLADNSDKCPDKPETFNDFQDDDGCPDEKPQPVVDGEIIILEKVYFETDKSYISAYYRAELDKVVATLKSHPKVTKVRVEGHADERASDEYNVALSDRRCNAVRDYLISQGIDAKRMEIKGYGEGRPVGLGHDEDSWSKNRRVEFVILAQ